MFGIANQLLAAVALSVATMFLINHGKKKYIGVTLTPLVFVAITTLTAGYQSITQIFWPLTENPAKAFQGYLNSFLTASVMTMAVVLIGHFIFKASAALKSQGKPHTLGTVL
jgi:carbon starvation protein